MTAIEHEPGDIIAFWREAGPERWFRQDDDFDRELAGRFLALHQAAANGSLDDWAGDADGSLALILVLDQFSRNMFRKSAAAFAQDAKALSVADAALRRAFDRPFDTDMRCFFYLPFEHSESLSDQHRCVALVHQLGDRNYLDYAILHREIIRRFGRFPHRNSVLGRHTSLAEKAFLETGGFSG